MYFDSYDDYNREVSTPCILFRKGEYRDSGCLDYIFGQEMGYLVWGGFRQLKTDNPPDAHKMHATWFEVGDTIAFVRMLRAKR